MKTERPNSFTYNRLPDKEIKNLRIAELIRRRGIISRTEISKITGINIVSTCSYIKNYIDEGIVLEKGFDVSTGGRKPELVELDIEGNRIIGLEVSRSAVKGVATDLALKVIKKIDASLQKSSDSDIGIKIVEIIKELVRSAAITADSLKAIGIAACDLDLTGLPQSAGQELGAKIFIGDSAAAAACGERYLNPDVTSDSFLYMFSSLGRGIMVRSGELFGESYSEETGYLKPWPEALSLVGTARQEILKGVGTLIVDLVKADMDKITEDTIVEATKRNDEVALGAMQSVAANLGIRIAYLINLFAPDTVVIGGGLEKGGELALDEIRRAVKKLSTKKYADAVKIIPAILGEDAVSKGAASLALREVFLKA